MLCTLLVSNTVDPVAGYTPGSLLLSITGVDTNKTRCGLFISNAAISLISI